MAAWLERRRRRLSALVALVLALSTRRVWAAQVQPAIDAPLWGVGYDKCGGPNGRVVYSWTEHRQNSSSILERGLYPAYPDYTALTPLSFMTPSGIAAEFVEVFMNITFPFYDVDYDYAFIAQTGYVSFSMPNETCTGTCLPSKAQNIPDPEGPMPAIMPFWGSIFQSQILHARLDVDTYLVVWEKAQLNCAPLLYNGDCAGSITFELVLYSNGTFEIIIPTTDIHYFDDTVTDLRFMVGYQNDDVTGVPLCGSDCASKDVLYGTVWAVQRTCENDAAKVRFAIIVSCSCFGCAIVLAIILFYNNVGRKSCPCMSCLCIRTRKCFYCIPKYQLKRYLRKQKREEARAKSKRHADRRKRGDESESDEELEKPKALPSDGLDDILGPYDPKKSRHSPYDPKTAQVSPIHATDLPDPQVEEPLTV